MDVTTARTPRAVDPQLSPVPPVSLPGACRVVNAPGKVGACKNVEVFCRGSNYGAASDILRTMILRELGGVYVDHDDLLPNVRAMPAAPAVPISVAPAVPVRVPRYAGFKYTFVSETGVEVPVNSFFASPANHPFLSFYLDRMLQVYTRLLRCDYQWLDIAARPMAISIGHMNDPGENWFAFSKGYTRFIRPWAKNFIGFTLFATGPDQLKDSLNAAGNSDRCREFGTDFLASTGQVGVQVGAAGAWT